eukprot:2115695-Amphidinium_carterae.1
MQTTSRDVAMLGSAITTQCLHHPQWGHNIFKKNGWQGPADVKSKNVLACLSYSSSKPDYAVTSLVELSPQIEWTYPPPFPAKAALPRTAAPTRTGWGHYAAMQGVALDRNPLESYQMCEVVLEQ